MTKARVNSDCGSMINMRKKADICSTVTGRVPTGEFVEVLKRNKEWSSVQYDGKVGHILNRFLVFGEKEDNGR